MNRVVVYLFLTGAFLLVGDLKAGMSQQDSLWHGEIAMSFSTQSDLRPGNKFALNTYMFKTNNHQATILGSLIQLKDKENEGLKYDLGYYRILDEGYSLIKFSYSNSVWFPKWTGEAKYWHNIMEPLSLGIGVRHVSYGRDAKVNLVSGDLTYYFKNWMVNYAYTTQLSGSGFQIFKLRKYGKHAGNYFEVGGGNSAQLAKGIDWQIDRIDSRFIQFGIQHAISKRIKIGFTTYYNKLISVEVQRSFIDYQLSLSKGF